jgi:phosphate transport system substrate-binding protein
MTGSLDRPYRSTALAIFVHKDNPLAGLTLAQADAIFGADHRRGTKNIRRWDGLGVSGDWRERAISLYGFAIRQDHAQYFEQAVMGGSQKWNDALREFGNDGAQILEALAQDRFGMALGSLAFRNPGVKALPLAADGGRFVAPTRDNVMTREYPLARPVSMVIRRPAGSPAPALLQQYLEFLLSAGGQQIVAKDGNYLPLPESVIRRERGKLQ